MDDVLKLSNQLCFPLYVAAKEMVGGYKPFLDDIGLTYTQYITMMALWEHKQATVKALGEWLYLDSGTLTPLLKRLEGKGLVRRERSKEDEREVMVALTEQGEGLKAQAEEISRKLAECMPLSAKEAGVLYRLLYQLI